MNQLKVQFKSLVEKIKGIISDVIVHWKKPAKNKHVSYSEILNYSIGGMGVQCIIYVVGYLALAAGNTLVGSTVGIRPMHLQYMAAIQGILGIAFPIIRGKMVDNTRTKYGRFRPYLALSGLPLLIMVVVYIWLPFERMVYSDKLIATFCLTIAISFVSPLFTDTYGELGSCLTPNTEERTNIFAISSIIYSFAPTIYYTFVPILSNLTGGLTDIRTYKYVIVPIGVIGVALSLFTAFGCKERVVTSKSYVQKVGLLEGMGAVFKNKYWWIRSSATILGFLEMATNVIFGWIYIYGTQDMVTFGILNTVLGTASGLSMLCTPFILKKLGNRKTLLMHNSINIVFTTFMLFTFKIPGVYFVFMYLNMFVNQLCIVYNPVLNSEVKDSIQYESGKRLDFTLGAAWTVLAPVQIALGFVLPLVYEMMGLTVNYDVLYDPMVRNNLFAVLCVCSIIGATMNLIPFFFYKLSREKHQMIILALRYRAVNIDYANGEIDYYKIREVVDMYNRAMEIKEAEPIDVKAKKKAYLSILTEKVITNELKESPEYKDKTTRKALIKETKQAHKMRRKQAWQEYREADSLNENKIAYEEVMAKELDKYNTQYNKVRYQVSCKIKDIDINALVSTPLDLQDIVWEEGDEKQDKKIKKYLAKVQANYLKMQNNIVKRYQNSKIVNTYWEDLEKALDTVATTKEEIKAKDKLVKEKSKLYNNYLKDFKVWLDAINFVKEKDSTENFEKYILPLYDEALEEIEKLDKIQEEKEAKEKEEHRLEIEKRKQEKLEKKAKKNKKEDK